jgi:NAD(P)-dependent dehydrogenase (short-subunit alcohol dehydrogenase family)
MLHSFRLAPRHAALLVMTKQQRTAIVTGAARGIGAAIARRLAGDGFAVGVVDLVEADCAPTVDAITSGGGTAIAVAADVADESAVDAAVARVAAELGAPTVLVNNAGFGPPGNLVDLPTEQWDRVLGVNLRGPFFAARATAPHMIDAGWGRVVNIASVSAVRDPGRVDYASAKAGLLGFTKTLALQLGPHGVTANAIAPGYIVSDMTRASARREGVDFAEHQRRVAEVIPVGRVGQPEDVAHTASYLASPGAGFVSGQVVYVAGGPVDRVVLDCV